MQSGNSDDGTAWHSPERLRRKWRAGTYAYTHGNIPVASHAKNEKIDKCGQPNLVGLASARKSGCQQEHVRDPL
ncbi:hypothetical protein CLAFUW4_01686 [Fulvia fulva]|uniref:Uncharacterized protein n=1 Tax=Passalora fulva TaxID=5499 RepID=A0A9Q8L5T3_PASFU|nr:uncharacterized protein CLAFUR5_01684 [Fulvia fulva]KAK4636011.1 hypothetical protein CLAFUR4_01684 [Fulvia fulva]KAK4636832.1 hypothetical protein CLAFUR0_01685 [Fulvia fulva]UJO11377.1 hypothetical protein CLAFUR5_01684 [Fulvia fulva]WPV08505.1 hypothetical protein CLAFUW4_01686 [Fulvia fulva]WPV24074.1 hypothetical protein CLAFUW7_01688 [Fulvia fulva]